MNLNAVRKEHAVPTMEPGCCCCTLACRTNVRESLVQPFLGEAKELSSPPITRASCRRCTLDNRLKQLSEDSSTAISLGERHAIVPLLMLCSPSGDVSVMRLPPVQGDAEPTASKPSLPPPPWLPAGEGANVVPHWAVAAAVAVAVAVAVAAAVA